jgi:formate hydrogenlyase subunit 6/NADH:ubiquinone oxidoreductase subunit I
MSNRNRPNRAVIVADYALQGGRITSGECILCRRCAHACPTDALHLSLGLDFDGPTRFVSAERT